MLPEELLDSLHSGDAVLFLGAGLSVGAGLPGWADLIRPFAQSVGSRWPDNENDLTTDHLLVAVQHYENQRGRHSLISYLRKELDNTGLQPTSIHRLIALLPVSTIFTTNYDHFIEQVLRQVNRHPNVIVDESDLAFWREGNVQVVRLCGNLTRPNSIVITQRDFNTYFATHPRLAERLRTTLESKTALFLGYSLQDPFFNQIWDNIGLDFGTLRRWGYAVLFDTVPLDADNLRHRGIQVINLNVGERDKSAVLEEWLITLTNALSSN